MLERERQNAILNHVRQRGFVSVKDLVVLLEASEATIRRDLTDMDAQGQIKRLHGGAEMAAPSSDTPNLPPNLSETPLDYRKELHLEKKKAIARKAVSLITPEDTIIIDGGSTTFWMADSLTSHRIQVITNSFAIADNLLKRTKNTVICAGGVVYPDSQIILNPFENDVFRHYSASKVFMGVKGIDGRGATNSDPLLIQTEREMITRGRELILLADSSKFESSGSLFLCGFDKVSTLISDSSLSETHRQMILSKGVKLLIAEDRPEENLGLFGSIADASFKAPKRLDFKSDTRRETL